MTNYQKIMQMDKEELDNSYVACCVQSVAMIDVLQETFVAQGTQE